MGLQLAMKKYDSDATRQIMTQKCQERVGVTPYPEQLDLADRLA